jgi:deoxyribose-phosphate aldolase
MLKGMDEIRPGGAAATLEESAEEFARKVNFQVLSPVVAEKDLHRLSVIARQHGAASMVVRSCDADSALRFFNLGVVQVASVVGHPFGGNATAVKVYECRDLLRRGVRQIYAYPNPGKMFSRQFQHQEVELIQMADACIEAGATLKIVADSRLLDEEMKIILCRMAKRVNAHFVASTEPRDLELLKKHCGHRVELEAGGVDTYEQARAALEAGCAQLTTARLDPLMISRDAFLKTS